MTIAKQDSQPHWRRYIREKVKELLIAGVDIGGKVYCSRPTPAFLQELPIMLVYFTDETNTGRDTRPRKYTRDMELVIQVINRYEKNIDEYFDSRCFEVEHILENSNYLELDFVQDIFLKRTVPSNYTAEGDENIETSIMYWSIVYKSSSIYFGDVKEFLRFENKIINPDGQVLSTDLQIIREE